jgi:hypothetical protein
LVQELVQVAQEEQVQCPWWSIVIVLGAECRQSLPSLALSQDTEKQFRTRQLFRSEIEMKQGFYCLSRQLPTLERKFLVFGLPNFWSADAKTAEKGD